MTNVALPDSLSFLTTGFLWVVFVVMVLIYAVYTSILVYHWKRYSYAIRRTQRIKRLYFIVSTILILIMFLALLVYSA